MLRSLARKLSEGTKFWTSKTWEEFFRTGTFESDIAIFWWCCRLLHCTNRKTNTYLRISGTFYVLWFYIAPTQMWMRKVTLTPINPCNVRAMMSPFMSHRVSTGINRDMTNMNKLLRPNMRLAPNCRASNPPGNCSAQCNQ